MRAAIRYYKLEASSIMEAIIAAVIILLSFSAGIMLYHSSLHSRWSGVKMKAFLEQSRLADSLSRSVDLIDQEIVDSEIRYEVSFHRSENFKRLLHLRIRAYDRSGQNLCDLNRLIDEK